MLRRIQFLALAVAASSLACKTTSKSPDGGSGPGGGPDASLGGVFADKLVGPTNCGQPPNPGSSTVQAVVQGNTTLSAQLLQQLASKASGGNVFFSPLSISTAMAMVTEGAQGSTQAQLVASLDFPAAGQELADGYGALACAVEANGEAPDGGQIDIANAVFGQQGDTFEAPFESTLQSAFGAPFTPVNFQGDPAGVEADINGWVSFETNGMIPMLLGPNAITPDMKLVLVDALYFNEYWATPFDPATNGTFNVTPEQPEQVPMLSGVVESAGYYTNSSVTIAELPFGNSHEAIDLILPSAGSSLTDVESSLGSGLAGWLSGLSTEAVLVTMPKFKMTWSANLIPAFQALGLTLPFSASEANFAGIDGQRDLFISLLQHEAALEVNEAGVTAAAATAVGLAGNAAPGWKDMFTANQPFLIILRDRPTGAILFLGQVTNPTG